MTLLCALALCRRRFAIMPKARGTGAVELRACRATSESSPVPPRARRCATAPCAWKGRSNSARSVIPRVSMHTHSFGAYLRCFEHDDWAGVGELMLVSAHKLAARRRRLSHLPRQHHPPRAAVGAAALTAAVAAHRRSRGTTRRGARLSPPRAHRHPLSGRQRGLPGEARRARPAVPAAEPRRAGADQPHHLRGADRRGVHRGGGGVPAARHAAHAHGGVRCGGARLHRAAADHERTPTRRCRRSTRRGCWRAPRYSAPRLA